MTPATVVLPRPLPPEEQARADLYAVIGRLFAEPPSQAFLDAVASAPRLPESDDAPLGGGWNRLADASRAMDADAARQEYDDLFIGVGKSEVNLHGSHWRAGFMMEKPLAELRTELAAIGLSRNGAATMLEDHVSALCETMRLLITGGDGREPAALDVQRNIFTEQMLPWIFDCCDAIDRCSLANYYRRVAELTRLFMTVERDSLVMD